MDKSQRDQIVSEILEMKGQYEVEVGEGGRKPWPRSIKDRVLSLCKSGMSCSEVENATGIPYHTFLPWRKDAGLIPRRKKKSKFHSLVVSDKTATVTVKDPLVRDTERSKTVTVTVTVQVEGLGSLTFETPEMAGLVLAQMRRS